MRGDMAALCDSFCAAASTDAPPTGNEREPPVPRPKAIAGVSPARRATAERQTKPFGGKLGVSRLWPWPVGLRPRQHRQGAARVKAQFGEFVGRRPRLLDVDRMSEAAVKPRRLRSRTARRKARNIGGSDSIVLFAGKVAAVVDEAEQRRVRQRLGPDEIAPALPQRRADQRARNRSAARARTRGRQPGAAIGIDRHGMRGGDCDVEITGIT